MQSVDFRRILRSIDQRLNHSPDGKFQMDETVATIARDTFNRNFDRNVRHSRYATISGIASVFVAGFSVYKFFITPIPAIGYAVASLVLNVIWYNFRNKEGYALQEAFSVYQQQRSVYLLSLGANIHQTVWSNGGAAPGFIPINKGHARTIMQRYAEKGHIKVIAYLAMLEPNSENRAYQATQALKYAEDIKTAQLLIDLGADIQACPDIFITCSVTKNLELLKFYVQRGASLDAGIDDCKKWEADMSDRQQKFGESWSPVRDKDVPNHLNPHFKTPLERLFISNKFDTKELLKSVCEDVSVYVNINTAIEFYNSLNKAGIRIRAAIAELLFAKLYSHDLIDLY